MKKWYKLDNVGKFYASIANAKIPKLSPLIYVHKKNLDLFSTRRREI